jgi:chromosome segregation ATPase
MEEQLNEAKVKIEVQTKEVTVLAKESYERQRMVVGLKEQLKTAQQARDDQLNLSATSERELEKYQGKLRALKQDSAHKTQLMDEWGKTLKAVDERMNSLTLENDELKLELQDYAAKNEELLRQNEHLVKGWKIAKEDSQTLQGELAKLKSSSEGVFDALQKKSIKQQLDETVEEKTSALQSQISKCIDSLQTKLDTCNQELAKLRKSKASLHLELQEAREDKAKTDLTIEDLKAQLEEAETEKQSLRKQLLTRGSDQHLNYKQKERRLRELEAELSTAHVALRQKQQELELSFAESENSSKVMMQTKEGELNCMQAELMSKKSELNLLRRDNELLQNAYLREAESLKAQFEGDLRRVRTELKLEYERRLQKARQSIEKDLQTRVAEKEATLTERDGEIERLNADRRQLREVVEELQERLREVTARLERQRASEDVSFKKQATDETEQLLKELDQLKAKHRNEIELFQSEVRRKDQEFEELRDRFRDKMERVVKRQSTWKERLMQEVGYLNKWIETEDGAAGPRIKAITARMELALMSDRGK